MALIPVNRLLTKQTRYVLTLLVISMLAGCATSSVFSPYPGQVAKIKQNIAGGNYSEAQEKLDGKRENADKLLYLMERGRVSQLAGDYDGSIEDFKTVIRLFDEIYARAKIRASSAVSQVGALLTNDNAIPYDGEAYERVFVHHFQALNYLYKGDIAAAGVEVRRANVEQQIALRKYEDELDDIKDSAQGKRIMAGNSDYKQQFASLSKLAGEVKNSFQNAYTFYLSGLIYEARGEYNDAYIDYKKAREIFPNNRYLQADVVRLAKQLGMKQDLELFKDKVDADLLKPMASNQGRVVVLFENNYVPEKREVMIPLFVIGMMHSIAFPTYNYQPNDQQPLTLHVGNNSLGRTDKIINVSAMAARALEEQMPMIMVRQGLRIIARESQGNARNNDALGLITSLAHLILNMADLRSWLTLPAEAQIMYATLDAGKQNLKLQVKGTMYNQVVNIRPGKNTILHVVAIDGQLQVKTIEL